jgi:hypothetical protein
MKQNSFPDLPKITSLYRYENFFNIYNDPDGTKFYNILRSIKVFPALDSSIEDEYIVEASDTWYLISYKYYNTMDLWWLVCEYNQIKDPTKMPSFGTTIKLLKGEYVWPVIQQLNMQINA